MIVLGVWDQTNMNGINRSSKVVWSWIFILFYFAYKKK